MTDEQPPIAGAPPEPGEAEAAAANRVAEGLPGDEAELDESNFDDKLQELRRKGFRTDSGARDLDDDKGVAAFDDGSDIYAKASGEPHQGDRTADRPEAGIVPDPPADDEPVPDPPLEPLTPHVIPGSGPDDFFETLGGISEREES